MRLLPWNYRNCMAGLYAQLILPSWETLNFAIKLLHSGFEMSTNPRLNTSHVEPSVDCRAGWASSRF